VDLLIELSRNRHQEFVPIPKYPSVSRDISFLIANTVTFTEIREAIHRWDNSLIREITVFDEYRGKQVPEGFRSLSLHLILCDEEKTLTIQRVDEVLAQVIKMLQDKWQVKQR
jgi:phenylalanyl-tRNA synthetase beta chain